MEWNLAEGSANLFIPVSSIPVEFRWIPEFTPECSREWCSPEWAGMEFRWNSAGIPLVFHWNLLIYLLLIIVCLFVTDDKQCLVGKGVVNPSIPSSSTTTTTIDDAHPPSPRRHSSRRHRHSLPRTTAAATTWQCHITQHPPPSMPRHPAPTTFASSPASPPRTATTIHIPRPEPPQPL